MSPDLIARIRDATDIRSLVSGYGVKLAVRGRVGVGLCPFHSEKTGSFHVNLKGHKYAGKFRCHGCGAHGDSIDFLELHGMTKWEAIRALAGDAGITVEGYKPPTPEERRQMARDAEERLVCAWWYRQRWVEARALLQRELSDPGILAEDSFGSCCGRLLRWIERERESPDAMAIFRAAKVDPALYRKHVQACTRKAEILIRPWIDGKLTP